MKLFGILCSNNMGATHYEGSYEGVVVIYSQKTNCNHSIGINTVTCAVTQAW